MSEVSEIGYTPGPAAIAMFEDLPEPEKLEIVGMPRPENLPNFKVLTLQMVGDMLTELGFCQTSLTSDPSQEDRI